MAIQTVIMVDDSVAPKNDQMFIVPCHSFPQTVYGIMVHYIFHGSFGILVLSRHSLHICTIFAHSAVVLSLASVLIQTPLVANYT